MNKCTVNIMPDNLSVEVESGTNLLNACFTAGIALDSPCGGRGTCGKCKVEIDGKTVLACKTSVDGDMTIVIPAGSRLQSQQVLLDKPGEEKAHAPTQYAPVSPIAKKHNLLLDEPTIEDNADDLTRVRLALKKLTGIDNLTLSLDTLKRIPDSIRAGSYEVNATVTFDGLRYELIDVEPGRAEYSHLYGLAVDIGTTTVACYLVNMDTGEIVDKQGAYNKQSVYGSDVISRIIYTDENGSEGVEALQNAVRNTINELVDEMVERNDVSFQDIKACVCAGNTVMIHMLMGVSARYLRLEPYIPAAVNFPPVRARHLGLRANKDAVVLTVPSVASYVGGDITAGVLSTGLHEVADDIELFIDIGTNGELVLGNSDWLMTCACSAGPAFEGSGITCGMRAMNGAVNAVDIDPETFEPRVQTIGNKPPLGICGSGLIDLLSTMLEVGVIDRSGKISEVITTPRVKKSDGEAAYVLAYAGEYENDKEISITESDIKNLLRAKAAVYAGIRVMLSKVDLPIEVISKVTIAGGFGSSINIRDAVGIGLLPDIDESKYEYVGNSSVHGALSVLLDSSKIAACNDIAARMTYLELSIGNQFMDEFVSAMFIPHTDLSLFPSRDT